MYCMKVSKPTKPKLHPSGKHKLKCDATFGGDNPSIKNYLGKTLGKGGSISQCGCKATRRDLEFLVSSPEDACCFEFETYNDLVNLYHFYLLCLKVYVLLTIQKNCFSHFVTL